MHLFERERQERETVTFHPLWFTPQMAEAPLGQSQASRTPPLESPIGWQGSRQLGICCCFSRHIKWELDHRGVNRIQTDTMYGMLALQEVVLPAVS